MKTKYVTLTIEAENLAAARARFARIETDTLNRFKVMGAAAHVLDGKERLELLHGILHPEGGKFAFDWDWLAPSGLSVKDCQLFADHRPGDPRPHFGGVHGNRGQHPGDHAHPGHQPE